MATYTINISQQLSDTLALAVTNATGGQFRTLLNTPSSPTNTIDVDWGDGTIETGLLPTFNSHNYTGSFTGDVTTTFSPDLSVVSSIDQPAFGAALPFSFDIADTTQLINLETISMSRPNTVTGDLTLLPPNIRNISFSSGSTVFGNLDNLPTSIQNSIDVVRITSFQQGPISGDISNVFRNASNIQMTDLTTGSVMTVTGDIANFVSPDQITVAGANTLFGDIANLYPNIRRFDISGNNTITGDLANLPTFPPTHFDFRVLGQNSITGDIANVGTWGDVFQIDSPNSSIFGNINNIPSKTFFQHRQGTGNLTGNLNQGSARALIVRDNNVQTIGGDLSGYNIDPAATFFQLEIDPLNAPITYNSTKDWSISPSGFIRIELRNNPGGAFTPAMVDQFLIDLDNSSFGKSSAASRLYLRGGFSRTSASDTAFNNLDTAGLDIQIT